MSLQFDADLLAVLSLVERLAPDGQTVYLVGGAVRDLLLGHTPTDLDFCLQNGSAELAQRVRRDQKAVGFMLDDERNTARVILNQGSPEERVLDFVRFVGDDLEEDLRNRDFTINAMALSLDDLQTLIDPLGGAEDLRQGLLKLCNPQSLQQDPLRALRGIRFNLSFGLVSPQETVRAVQAVMPVLQRVSGERIRDEVWKGITQAGASRYLEALDSAGLLPWVFPQTAMLLDQEAVAPHVYRLWDHTLQTIRYLEWMMAYLKWDIPKPHSPKLAQIFDLLKPYRTELGSHFDEQLQAGRPRWVLFYIAALYHDVGKPLSRTTDASGEQHFFTHPHTSAELVGELKEAFLLGNHEDRYLKLLVGEHMRLHYLSASQEKPSGRAVFRFFKKLGDVGLDIIFLSLADALAAKESTLTTEEWESELLVARTLLEAWYKQPEKVIRPIPLFDGNDLQEKFELEPGPVVGRVLKLLIEAEAAGEVTSQEEAWAFVEKVLKTQ